MTDVLRLLPPFEWRGRRYPVLTRAVSFAHDNAPHKLQYRDGEFVEMTGAKSFTFTYTLAMREDIARGPYKNLFTEGLIPLLTDCRDRTPGPLVDPVYGEFRCVPASFTDDSDNNKRDGTDVRVEFTHAPEFVTADDEQRDQNITGISGLVADAGQLDQQLTLADWNQEPSPDKVTDILSAINGLQIIRRTTSTVSAIAADLDMTVAELLSLNPFLARSPVVPAGTVITKRLAGI